MGFDRSSFQELAAKVQGKLEDFFPAVLQLEGEVYEVASYGGARGGEHEAGGFVDDLGQVVRLRKALRADAPELGERALLNNEAVRIVSVDEREWEDSWSIRVELVR